MFQSRPVALVLEDEPLISMDVEQALDSAGFEVIAVTSCAAAHAVLDSRRPAVAIVDIMLLDGPCIPIAERLVGADIPFVVHSGDQPEPHANTPFAGGIWVSKPSSADQFMAAVLSAAAR